MNEKPAIYENEGHWYQPMEPQPERIEEGVFYLLSDKKTILHSFVGTCPRGNATVLEEVPRLFPAPEGYEYAGRAVPVSTMPVCAPFMSCQSNRVVDEWSTPGLYYEFRGLRWPLRRVAVEEPAVDLGKVRAWIETDEYRVPKPDEYFALNPVYPVAHNTWTSSNQSQVILSAFDVAAHVAAVCAEAEDRGYAMGVRWVQSAIPDEETKQMCKPLTDSLRAEKDAEIARVNGIAAMLQTLVEKSTREYEAEIAALKANFENSEESRVRWIRSYNDRGDEIAALKAELATTCQPEIWQRTVDTSREVRHALDPNWQDSSIPDVIKSLGYQVLALRAELEEKPRTIGPACVGTYTCPGVVEREKEIASLRNRLNCAEGTAINRKEEIAAVCAEKDAFFLERYKAWHQCSDEDRDKQNAIIAEKDAEIIALKADLGDVTHHTEIAALQEEVAKLQKGRCPDCGATINDYPIGCPLCGAPQCCEQCCTIEHFKEEIAALREQLAAAEKNIEESGNSRPIEPLDLADVVLLIKNTAREIANDLKPAFAAMLAELKPIAFIPSVWPAALTPALPTLTPEGWRPDERTTQGNTFPGIPQPRESTTIEKGSTT